MTTSNVAPCAVQRPPDAPPTILYKHERLEAEVARLQPRVREVLFAFAKESEGRGWPAPFVTEVGRTRENMREYYVPHAERLVAKFKAGRIPNGKPDYRLASMLSMMTPAQVSAWAADKFSWHLVYCAVDLRTHVEGVPYYSPEQKREVMRYLASRCPVPQWELLAHDVTAPHIHFGIRDFGWRQKFAIRDK